MAGLLLSYLQVIMMIIMKTIKILSMTITMTMVILNSMTRILNTWKVYVADMIFVKYLTQEHFLKP